MPALKKGEEESKRSTALVPVEDVEGKTLSKPKKKNGRPTIFTPDLADTICDHLINGMSLRQIAAIKGMPQVGTKHLEHIAFFRIHAVHSNIFTLSEFLSFD
ncbi:hypothetical protein [Flexibacterium corallicola]|uniref:hypothetical protein n=1 Tax=Flexibacterium corallicola TaxID=3037259 RepID=UPI00286F1B33|nr:hypothetical protein [Pseudovibrio sp. M1P-2-3]